MKKCLEDTSKYPFNSLYEIQQTALLSGIGVSQNEIEKIKGRIALKMAIRYFEKVQELELEIEKQFRYDIQIKLNQKIEEVEEQLNNWVAKIPEEYMEKYLEITTRILEKLVK